MDISPLYCITANQQHGQCVVERIQELNAYAQLSSFPLLVGIYNYSPCVSFLAYF